MFRIMCWNIDFSVSEIKTETQSGLQQNEVIMNYPTLPIDEWNASVIEIVLAYDN